jgi:biopolymer transport protein TolQ
MDLVTPLTWGLVNPPIANAWLALKESSGVGWVIIGILGVASIFTWTIIFSKWMELRKIRKLNLALEKKLHPNSCNSLLSLTENSFGGHRSHYQQLLLNALKAFFRQEFGSNYHEDDEATYAQRMNHSENALRRAVANRTEEYAKNMVFLSIIVTSAPFIGLLGTVWGVMDAFGAIGLSGGGSIKDLAPGVSSALLTTVGGLVVAIPSVVGYNLLLDRVRGLTIEIENFASLIADRFELDWLKAQPGNESTQYTEE